MTFAGHVSTGAVRSCTVIVNVQLDVLFDPSVTVPARIRHTDAELDQIAVDLATEAPLTNAVLRKETGLDATQARKVLRRLAERGELVQRGSRRGTRYEIAGS